LPAIRRQQCQCSGWIALRYEGSRLEEWKVILLCNLSGGVYVALVQVDQRLASGNVWQPTIYKIRIKGQLDSQWTDWFEGLTIALDDNGDTLLIGAVIDQSALHGLLKRVTLKVFPRSLLIISCPAVPAITIRKVNRYQCKPSLN